jgi:hypothetical protein
MEPIYIYFEGTAGSGKSSLTRTFKLWMDRHGYNAVTINLDPGAERLPYSPDIDVREWVSLWEVMDDYSLGPNGAQIMSADLLATKAQEVKRVAETFKADYFLVDTPGQIELFVFRESGKYVMDCLSPGRSLVAFLIDSFLARQPNGLVSQLLLGVTSLLRLGVPLCTLISKSDLLEREDKQKIQEWCKNSDRLYGALISEPSIFNQLSVSLLQVISELGTELRPWFTSSKTLEGLEDLYTHAQEVYMGGEDLSKD